MLLFLFIMNRKSVFVHANTDIKLETNVQLLYGMPSLSEYNLKDIVEANTGRSSEPPHNLHRSVDRSPVSARRCLYILLVHVSCRHRAAECGGPVEIVVT